MGTLHRLTRPGYAEVFSPVNPRPAECCRLMVFQTGDEYAVRFDAEGIQFALGEHAPSGYHVIETPDSDGPLLRYIEQQADGSILVKQWKGGPVCHVYSPFAIAVLGRVFQWIRNFQSGERWELISGPARLEAAEADTTLPFYELSKLPR